MNEVIQKHLGKKVLVLAPFNIPYGGDSEPLYFEAKIIDVKLAYGRERYQVQPIKGVGKVWVEKYSELKKD